ncbi:hypothetical protein GCK72_020930 [Caenorhabditis remanei]|uniref:TIL domain-containing protein n=1 Tax=Caenorhabditis remanei TaxID=31234 RepID=A0A6A5GIZ6_CAERE|nr:hypothetical protein GCK72_020930 [Caenorhabditis remanei]KAF1754369.1 hypothetical protein GCK72_020930 [Caenorhabditis remanei]
MKMFIIIFAFLLTVASPTKYGPMRCDAENQILNPCATQMYRTCERQNPPTGICVERCDCAPGFVAHPTTKKCVTPDNCP